MKKRKVLTIFGTRPEAIKMAPLVKELAKYRGELDSTVCVTAQHREMLDQVLNLFDIAPDYDLNIMQDRQSLTDIAVRALQGLDRVMAEVKPDLVLVHGDTSTTFFGSLAAFYHQARVGHVEAGLRTFDKFFPFPEEINRRLTGALSDLHFAPTGTAKENLLREGVAPETIFVTGNTVIDALKTTVRSDYRFQNGQLNDIDFARGKTIVVEVHRRENFGEPMERVMKALRAIVEENEEVRMVFPVHKNPAVREVAYRHLAGLPRVALLEPLETDDFHNLMAKGYFLISDSGGVQEEAPALGVPVLLTREVTERPEAVQAGTVKLVGTDFDRIVQEANRLLRDIKAHEAMAKAQNPYGDGRASERIVTAIRHYFGLTTEKPQEFTI